MRKAVVLVSGGIDSAAALWWARERYAVTALSFDLAGRPRGEVLACAALVRRAGVPLLRVGAPFLVQRPSGYVPARNLVYHGIALSIAEDRGASAVVAGHNRSDAGFFADARPSFFRRLERLNGLALRSATPPMREGGGVRIVLPFSRLTDAGVLRRARGLGVPLELTWSCYRDGARPCGRCSACRGRLQSFLQSQIEDPT